MIHWCRNIYILVLFYGCMVFRTEAAKPKILLIHGMFLNSQCYDEWVQTLNAKGFDCYNISWPTKEELGMANRTTTSHPEIAKLTLTRIVNYYDSIITTMPDTPYLIGHSMGSLVVQLLLQRGKGKAGVAICSAPPKGIKSYKLSYIKANKPALALFKSTKQAYLMSFKKYTYALANMLTKEEQKNTYRKWLMYESMKVWKAPLTKEAKIDYSKSVKPLLLVSGTKDVITPSILSDKTYRKYKKYNRKVVQKVYTNRGHMILMETGWMDVLNDISLWLLKQS